MAEIDQLLQHAEAMEASDLHIKSGMTPRMRVIGQLEEATGFGTLAAEDVDRLTGEILSTEQLEQFQLQHELDFTYGTATSRFRCAYFKDYRGTGAVFRRIPTATPNLESLSLPPDLEQFAHLHRGLVLVTGASGAGKSSTLASLINIINSTYSKHIITLEDPIEFLYEDQASVIHQRGMHYDFETFEEGIVSAMRQDPDVMVIGELRDLESIRRALTAAETGVLVFGTLHTNSATDTIDRIIDAFPAHEQGQVRAQLSESLAGVISQALLRRMDSPGRIPATEVLVATPAVGSIIREGKSQDLVNIIQSGRARGMHTMDDSLNYLVRRRVVEPKEAFVHARNKAKFEDTMFG